MFGLKLPLVCGSPAGVHRESDEKRTALRGLEDEGASC